MKLSIIRDEQPWRDRLIRCGIYDFYHTWDFHVISKNNGEGSPIMFVAEDGDRGLLLPLLERSVPGTNLMDLTSVYGYPSPLTYGIFDNPERTRVLWRGIMGCLRDCGYVTMFARGHPMLTPDVLRGDYYKHVGDIVYLDCGLSEEDQIRTYRRNHRQNIIKLRKIGVQCVRGKGVYLLNNFERIYKEAMRSIGAKDYYLFSEHYYDQMLSATDFDSQILLAEWNGIAVAAGLLVFCGKFSQYHLSGTDRDYYKLAPSKLLIDEARRATMERGARYMIIGGGYRNRSDDLLKFKKGFSNKIGSFSVIQMVLHKKKYSDLNEGRESEFFPIYRATALEKI